ncbi:MAG: response regulator transcription factor [Patescibacteria group bacterium]
MKKILLIEDNADIQALLKELLQEQDYFVKKAGTAAAALEILKKGEPDLVILDLGLPDMSGESLCQKIRKDYPSLPIVILTARDTSRDIVRGLNLGADDYIAKPFNANELLARIKARLRQNQGNDILTAADLELNSINYEVKRNGKSIKLTPQEFRLLEYLLINKGRVLSRATILNRLWLTSPDIETRVVDVYMGYLRKKIDAGHKIKLIQSIRGFGYTIKQE